MKVLFVHQNFPGQYLHLARMLGADPANEVVFITQRQGVALPGVRTVVYRAGRAVTSGIHHYLQDTEAGILNAQAVVRVALDLKQSGFTPDVMLGHNGWGEIWYLKEVFPRTPLLGYFEFFYRLHGADVDFDPAAKSPFDSGPRLRSKNIGNLLGLDAADLGQCPTQWQKSLYPARYHSLLHVIHEGIDTRIATPNAMARWQIPGSDTEVRAGDEVVTYIARNLEPYRGFPQFMRSLPRILEARPTARVLIVGGDDTSYGAKLPEGRTFRQELLAEVGASLDMSRVHFLGKVSYESFLTLLQISRAHVYLTYPFVLSWSMLEAMSSGCLVIGSRTPPVEEVIRHGENGLLVDFFDTHKIADQVIDVLREPRAWISLRENARQTILRDYDLHNVCLPAHLRLLRTLVERTGTTPRKLA